MRTIHIATTTLALLLAGGTAWAHAHLRTAIPAPDSTVQAAPATVTIDFTEGVEPRFSTIAVEDAAGHTIGTGPATTAPGDARRLSVGLPPLQPGTYTVTWHATSIDTHKSDGTFRFTVRP